MISRLNHKKNSHKSSKLINDLNQWNIGIAILFVIEAVLLLFISKDRVYSITTSYTTNNTLLASSSTGSTPVSASHHIFDMNILYVLVTILLISALAHILVTTYYRNSYEKDLTRETNKLRWVEYSLTMSLMLVAIGVVIGIYDLSTLIMIFVISVISNVLMLMSETYSGISKRNRWPWFMMAIIAAVLPWVIFVIYIIGSNVYGLGNLPSITYWIFISMFVLYIGQLLNTYLIYNKKSNWADYVFSERMYMILSFITKSLLAWEIFLGILHS